MIFLKERKWVDWNEGICADAMCLHYNFKALLFLTCCAILLLIESEGGCMYLHLQNHSRRLEIASPQIPLKCLHLQRGLDGISLEVTLESPFEIAWNRTGNSCKVQRLIKTSLIGIINWYDWVITHIAWRAKEVGNFFSVWKIPF